MTNKAKIFLIHYTTMAPTELGTGSVPTVINKIAQLNGVTMMTKEKLFKAGEFLITNALPEEIYTPEDFTQEQRLVAQSAAEFVAGALVERKDELEELNPELLRQLLLKDGELGFLSAEIPEVYGGSDLDKVSWA